MKHLFLFFCLLLCSCEYSELDGYCSNPVKLSKEELLFSAEGGIGNVIVESRGFRLSEVVQEVCEGKRTKIECSWFSAEVAYDSIIIVSVNQNETEEERKREIFLQSDNCYASFLITQAPK